MPNQNTSKAARACTSVRRQPVHNAMKVLQFALLDTIQTTTLSELKLTNLAIRLGVTIKIVEHFEECFTYIVQAR